jgi:arsenate reductase (glutaredoxin)
MHKIFYLSTCSTCRRILSEISPGDRFEMQDIKHQPISGEDLERLRSLSGSYRSLFSTRSRQYAAMGLKDKELSEQDLKKLILSEYTFLKRPVIVSGEKIFIGSDKNVISELKRHLGK